MDGSILSCARPGLHHHHRPMRQGAARMQQFGEDFAVYPTGAPRPTKTGHNDVLQSSSSQPGMGIRVRTRRRPTIRGSQTGPVRFIYNKASGWLGAGNTSPMAAADGFVRRAVQSGLDLSVAGARQGKPVYLTRYAGVHGASSGAIDPQPRPPPPAIIAVPATGAGSDDQRTSRRPPASRTRPTMSAITMQGRLWRHQRRRRQGAARQNTQQRIANATVRAYSNAWNTARSSRLSNLRACRQPAPASPRSASRRSGRGRSSPRCSPGSGSARTAGQPDRNHQRDGVVQSATRCAAGAGRDAGADHDGVPKAWPASASRLNRSTATQPLIPRSASAARCCRWLSVEGSRMARLRQRHAPDVPVQPGDG